MVEINTHLSINSNLVGTVVKLESNYSVVKLTITNDMISDSYGLAHGGFTFGLADYAAMVAVNDPNVVLGSANTRFLAPIKHGDTIYAVAKVAELNESSGKKRIVSVDVFIDDESKKKIFEGEFICFVLPKHILS